MGRFRYIVLYIVCAGLLSACQSLRDPYKIHEDSGLYDARNFEFDPEKDSSTLSRAMTTSATIQTKYIASIGDHEEARFFIGTAVLAGAAYAGLMGVSEGIAAANSSDQIAAIASGSALGLGWASLFTSPRRQAVYGAGIKAVSCVQRRAAPFNVSTKRYSQFSNALDGDTQGDVTAQLSFSELIAFVKYDDKDSPLVAASENTLADATLLREQIEKSAAADMQSALIKIDVAVMNEVRRSSPDLNAIESLSDSLPGFASQLGKGEIVDELENPVIAEARLTNNANKVTAERSDQRAALESRRLTLDKIIRAIKAEIVTAGQITDCELENAFLNLEVQPAKLELVAGKEAELSFRAVHGEPPFSAYFLGNPNGLTIRHTSPLKRVFSVSASGETRAGTHTIIVVDKTGLPAEVRVEIGSADPELE